MHICDSLAMNSQVRLITRANIIVELIGRSCRVRTDARRLKLPLRESTSRLWRKARGDLPVPERIHESLKWIRKVSHAAATATARKGDKEEEEWEGGCRRERKGVNGGNTSPGLDSPQGPLSIRGRAHTILLQTAMRIFCRRRRRRRRPTHDIPADTGARRSEWDGAHAVQLQLGQRAIVLGEVVQGRSRILSLHAQRQTRGANVPRERRKRERECDLQGCLE